MNELIGFCVAVSIILGAFLAIGWFWVWFFSIFERK